MRIDVLTLFPGMFSAVMGESIIKRAIVSKKVLIKIHNIRDYTKNKHKKVDNKPFGGGCGMVFNLQPIFDAFDNVRKKNKFADVILLTPQGRPFQQQTAWDLSRKKGMILISGHYEGIDERIKPIIDMELSIGDYILTGGEIPAMAVIDAVIRLLPGVLGHNHSCVDESFNCGLLEYPQYTRPAEYRNLKVPDVLLSGNHKSIITWRRMQSILKTIDKRPDLIKHINQLELGE